MISQPKEIELYVTADGKVPFDVWLESIADRKTRAVIDARLARVRLGLIGDVNDIGEGVHELRINFGAGYRIYFANIRRALVLLLCGGDKSTQRRDVKAAIAFWVDYQARTTEERGRP